MSDTILLSTPRAARYVGAVSAGSLHRWRTRGEGPTFVQVGRKVFYRPNDLDRWLETCSRANSTQ